jgi:pimeloyl-ACP methyl ester carboxylesterase
LRQAGWRTVVYDHRDHGRSGPATGPYALEDVVQDGLAVLDQLCGDGPVDWIGLSTGGFVGMRIAARHPERIRRLVLMDTSAAREPGLKRMNYELLLLGLRLVGIKGVLGPASKSLIGRSFLKDPSRQALKDAWLERMAAYDPKGLHRFGKAIFARPDFIPQLPKISAPTLVLVGAEDVSTPVARAEELSAGIPGASLQVIPGAGHLSTIEAPEQTAARILAHLKVD